MTYGGMQDRIADEIARTDLTSQIRLAIQSAIRHYEIERFWSNETQATLTTSSSQVYYPLSGLASAYQNEDSIILVVNQTKYPLIKRAYDYLEAVDASTTLTGQPTDYAIYKNNIRLFPTPNGAYPFIMSYVSKPATLSATTDDNFWTTDAESLIRGRAKWDVYINLIRDQEGAKEAKAVELDALQSLRGYTAIYSMTGRTRPSTF